MEAFRVVLSIIKERPLAFWACVIVMPIIYYCGLMLSLVLTFKNVPNYVTLYDWFGNVAEIFRATPSICDAIEIMGEEWLLEIGFMNYDYGFGISEWSLNIMPFRWGLLALLGALLVINYGLYQRARTMTACHLSGKRKLLAASGTGLGAALVAMGSMTMFWVVCCASPSWVVGLAMLGWISVSTALTLEHYESLVLSSGFLFLLVSFAVLLLQVLNGQKAAHGNDEVAPVQVSRSVKNV